MAATDRQGMSRSRCWTDRIRAAGGGTIPEEDVRALKQLGVAAVYTPKDFDLNRIMGDLVGLIEKRAGEIGRRNDHNGVARDPCSRSETLGFCRGMGMGPVFGGAFPAAWGSRMQLAASLPDKQARFEVNRSDVPRDVTSLSASCRLRSSR